MKIGVNCGHTLSGQAGSGAVGFINESDETRKVGYKLMEHLRAAGHKVYDCTNDKAKSKNENLYAIVSMANKQPLDLFVSIHFNAGRGKGAEVYTYGGKEHAEAVNVCKKMGHLGFANRGVKDGSHLYVIKRTNAKAILIEVCFVDTKSDTDLYKLQGVDKVAKAICEAITGAKVEETPVNAETSTNNTKNDNKTEQGEDTVTITLPVLRNGSIGDEVRTLQRLLIALGYSCGSCGADGHFGGDTYKAVKKYQTAKILAVDGIVGKETWLKLLKG